jgi:hypothetical protein
LEKETVLGRTRALIKKEDYKWEYNIPHVTDEQVLSAHSDAEAESFRKFMYGQTYMIRSDGVPGIYAWDYERWLFHHMKPEQSYDWD